MQNRTNYAMVDSVEFCILSGGGHCMQYTIKSSVILGLALVPALLCTPSVSANKSSVSLDVPQSAAKGSVIKIKITVTHNANYFLHYTEWAHVVLNGKEIARWDYTWKNRPETAVFTKEVEYTVTEPAAIEAEAGCNIHGSKGPAKAAVAVSP